MVKAKIKFVCQECGTETPKWYGRCPGCGEWNTLVEEAVVKNFTVKVPSQYNKPLALGEIEYCHEQRVEIKIPELDRVLGGGLVQGSLVLIGGDPGIGKSTLLLQAAANLSNVGVKILYVSGEESIQQIKLRSERLNITTPNLFVAAETDLEIIFQYIDHNNPSIIIIDSIQTIYSPELTSAPGSVGQVREGTAKLMRLAKSMNKTILLVGHVTKEGSIAGPKVLEHMVDTVIYLEGERHHSFRILRAVKNRFGSTNEIGIFEMQEKGLVEVKNPSQIFLAERPLDAIGSIVIASMEGTRPLLLEIQALVSSSVFGNPRRLTTGLDLNRLLLMLAVLEKKVGFIFNNQDVYVNVAGGVRIDEPAGDLGICMSLVSSLRNTPIDSNLFILGEVGLTGEVRAISQIEQRIQEGAKLGFTKCIIPNNNLKYLHHKMDIEVLGVKSIEEAIKLTFN